MFEYKETAKGNPSLVLKSCNKVEVQFFFDAGDVDFIEVDGVDFEANSDSLYGLFVIVNGSFLSLNALVLLAEKEMPGILEEIRKEIREEEEHARELSSPYLTGRI